MRSAHHPSALRPLLDLLAEGPLAVITGAGLSAASGIPTYRDDDGQWQHTKPIQHQDFLRSEATRRRYWARSFAGWPLMARARPNAAHQALAELEHLGAIGTVITQNVDGLHQRAGSRSVIELHGAIRQVCCLDCMAIHSRNEVQRQLQALNPDFAPGPPRSAPDGDAHLEADQTADFRIPACPACSGRLKPDVVFFGDNVPVERVSAATEVVLAAPALLIVGSSLMVWSGYRFAELAHRQGKRVVAINRGRTRADGLLSFKMDGDCGEVLASLASLLQTQSVSRPLEVFG